MSSTGEEHNPHAASAPQQWAPPQQWDPPRSDQALPLDQSPQSGSASQSPAPQWAPAPQSPAPLSQPMWGSPQWPVPARTARPVLFSRGDLRAGLLILLSTALLGLLLGVLWAHTSPGRPLAYLVTSHTYVPDETESFVSTDGRFLIYTSVAGVVLALLAWCWRTRRGPVMLAALVLGGAVGAYLTDLVGTALGGGTSTGKAGSVVTAQLQVHAHGLLAAQAFFAAFVYGLACLFSSSTDLGVLDHAAIDPGAQQPITV